MKSLFLKTTILVLTLAVAVPFSVKGQDRAELDKEIDNLLMTVKPKKKIVKAYHAPKRMRLAQNQRPSSNQDVITDSEVFADNGSSDSAADRAAQNAERRAQLQAQPIAQAQILPAQPVYVLPAPVQQPTTVVEATPLRESRADILRKKRAQIEQETEERVSERLENSRIEEENIRAQKLFDRLEGKSEAPAVAPVAQYQAPLMAPAPVYQQAAPVQMIAPAAPVIETVTPAFDLRPEDKPKFYMGAVGGVGEYPTVNNVRGIYAVGANGGVIFPYGLIAELGITFSTYDVKDPRTGQPMTPCGPYCPPLITEMDQYNFTGALKFQFLEGSLRPLVGALASYTHRNYEEVQYYNAGHSTTSNAFDIGGLVGLDVALGSKFTVGTDLRYLFNLSYHTDSGYNYSFTPTPYGKPVESLSYYIFGINSKITF